MPIDYTRRSYPGAATSTTLSSGVGTTDTSVSVGSTTGWPTSGGPFFIVIDPGLTQEEKLLISTVSGTTLTVTTRGADGTVAAAHASGATVYPCFTATDADTANAHYNDVADNHQQYLNVARHDVTARHAFGAAFATPSTPPATGTSGSAGVAGGPARSDHAHAIGAGSVVAGSFAAGAIQNADISGSAAISASKLQSQFLTPGTYGDGTHVAQTTVNQQGVVTGITSTAITFPAAPFVPTSRAKSISPSTTRTTTSQTYVDFPDDTSLSFTKALSGTKLIVRADVCGVALTTAGADVFIGFNVGGTDYDIASMHWNASGNSESGMNKTLSGSLEIDGVAAGTYTVKLRWRCDNSNTVTALASSMLSYSITETN